MITNVFHTVASKAQPDLKVTEVNKVQWDHRVKKVTRAVLDLKVTEANKVQWDHRVFLVPLEQEVQEAIRVQ